MFECGQLSPPRLFIRVTLNYALNLESLEVSHDEFDLGSIHLQNMSTCGQSDHGFSILPLPPLAVLNDLEDASGGLG